MKIVTAAEMREIDRVTSEKYGVASLALMENAGAAVAAFARKHFKFDSVCVVCGKGNNGGDGFVAARRLFEADERVSVLVLARGPEDLRGDAAEMCKKLYVKPLWIAEDGDFDQREVREALQAGLIIDAILGTGFAPPLKGLARRAVEIINELPAPVVAVDLPSGADADHAPDKQSLLVHADAIVTFTAPKPAHVFGGLTTGPIAVAQIGSPAKAVSAHGALNLDVMTAADVQALFQPRPRNAHKGDFGHVLVIGGSVGKAGAAAMVGMAALRTGAGLVTVACPKSVQPTVAAFAPELMTVPLPETHEGTVALLALAQREQLLQGKTAVVIGPGLSRNPETAEFVRDFVSICSTSLVLDADGINAFAGRVEEIQKDPGDLSFRVLTPHPGEMGTLIGVPAQAIQLDRMNTARDVARQAGACVVLKGYQTIIASPYGHVWINPTGNPGMAKGGSGDVLSGMMGAVLARRSNGMAGHKVTVHGPEAHELNALKQQFEETQDPEIGEQLEEQMAAKTEQVVALLTGLEAGKAVYLHGLAGDIAARLYGESSMIATDVIDCIPEALEACQEEAAGKFAYLQR